MPTAWPALPPYERMGCHLRHPARPHAGSGQAGRGARSARTPAAARRAAPDRARLGDAAAARTGRLRCAWSSRWTCGPHEAVVGAQRRTIRTACRSHRTGRSGEVTRDVLAAVRATGGPGGDRSPAAGGTLDHAAGRKTMSTPRYDPAQVDRLLRGGDPRGAGPGRATARPTAAARHPVNAWWGSFDLAVSLFSGLPAEPPSDDFIMRNAMDAQQVAVGLVARRRPLPAGGLLRLRLSRARGLRDRDTVTAGRPLGRQRWASTYSTGTTSAPARIRTVPRSNSASRRSGMRAQSAAGIRRCLPVWQEFPRRSPDRPRLIQVALYRAASRGWVPAVTAGLYRPGFQ